MLRRAAGFWLLIAAVSSAPAAWAETLETGYLRLGFNAERGVFDVLQVDLTGQGQFGQNLLAGAGRGLYVTSRPGPGEWTRPAQGGRVQVEAVALPEGSGLLIRGLNHGAGVTEAQQVSLARDAPVITLRRQIRITRNARCLTLGQLRLAADPAATPSTIFFAGRQGVASGHTLEAGELRDPDLACAGAVSKQPATTFVMTSEVPLHASLLYDAQGAAAVGLSVWDAGPRGRPLSISAGEIYQHVVTLAFGRAAARHWSRLKETTSAFDPRAEDFIFWCSHVGTVRPFPLALGESGAPGGEPRLQRTASVIDPGLPPAIINAYRFCWLRDAAHGWKSGLYVAGPSMLPIMRGEIEAFSAHLNDRGWPPTYLGPKGEISHGNLDGMGLLIGMIYDYTAKTGDLGFLESVFPEARRCAWAILALLGPHGLPVVGKDGDTYPDLGFIKGEQTYLAAVCYDGLTKMAVLCAMRGEASEAQRWREVAQRIQTAANRPAAADGLWDPIRGAYVGWCKPDGTLYSNEESFANLLAIQSGLCDDPAQVRAIFARLNANFQRYYLDGLCPTAHSIAPYPNGLNQWCPWIGGWDLLARAAHRAPRTDEVLARYLADYQQCDYPFQEATGFQQTRASAGNRGRLWDSWGLLALIYGGHYGIAMRPAHLRIWPSPLKAIPDDQVRHLRWQGAYLDIGFEGEGPAVRDLGLMGATWPSAVLPRVSGRARVTVMRGPDDGPLLLVDASPEAELLGCARQSPTRLELSLYLPCAGPTRYLVRCPSGTEQVRVEARQPLTASATYDAQERLATILVTAPRGMRAHLSVHAEPTPPTT